VDNVTHALAGCLMGAGALAAITRRGTAITPAIRRTTIAVGIIAAEFPDSDLVYSGDLLGMGQLAYPLHHRGHTHTFVFALVSAVAIWGVARLLSRTARPRAVSGPLLWLALAGTLSHIVLDWTNNYGVHPWWPLDSGWFYGDAIFIVEPWLWVVALPPLYFLATQGVARALFVLAALAILAASWFLGQVPRPVAAVVTIGLVLWTLLNAVATNTARLTLSLVGWIAIEITFFATTRSARREIQRVVGPTFVDVVVTPTPGDPFCLRALVVTADATTYAVTSATITPLPAVRGASACTGPSRTPPQGDPVGRPSTPTIQWNVSWRRQLAELRDLVATNCRAAAAMQYIRVPQWRTNTDGSVELYDARYGDGSFASVTIPLDPDPCPRFVPGWTPPRQNLLGP
jgi:inner membrane protein